MNNIDITKLNEVVNNFVKELELYVEFLVDFLKECESNENIQKVFRF